ncbi:hypothetical protein HZC30_04220 [Candidatus Woesearchaeota archaeon]|nr:hypothetical protein [Candidatus Woesearchaeota archaeon]
MQLNRTFPLLLVTLLLITLLLITLVSAQPGTAYHLKLLAIQEVPQGYAGSDADLYLELKEGSGRVFLDTYPLTKMDTQISTRFAKEIACKHYHLDCSKYDFIYTIKAKSNIVGGPSAGAAMAALTAIAVMDLEYDETVAITGTINSGATIGPVGGLKEKIEAAKAANLKKVLLPKGTAVQKLMQFPLKPVTNTSNNSTTPFNLIEYGKKNLSLEVMEISDLDEALFQLTGKSFNSKPINITRDVEYQKIMKGLQQLLCDRTDKIESEINQSGVEIDEKVRADITLKKEAAQKAIAAGDDYSGASFCFGNNVALKSQFFLQKEVRISYLNTGFNNLEQKIQGLNKELAEEKVDTIADLQALMIVKERLNDVQQQIELFNQGRETKPLEELYYYLAYAEERYFSALSWMQFFSMEGKKFVMNEEQLKNSCLEKVSEAEERYQYATIYLGEISISYIQDKIDSARNVSQKEPELCLMEAAQAKAEADAILSSMGVGIDNAEEFLAGKSKAVERVIAENSAEGIFPILGYSYYQYARSLQEQDKYLALVYMEYALEMSDLSIYFPEEKSETASFASSFTMGKEWGWIGMGIIIGVLITSLVIFTHKTWFCPVPKLKYVKGKK